MDINQRSDLVFYLPPNSTKVQIEDGALYATSHGTWIVADDNDAAQNYRKLLPTVSNSSALDKLPSRSIDALLDEIVKPMSINHDKIFAQIRSSLGTSALAYQYTDAAQSQHELEKGDHQWLVDEVFTPLSHRFDALVAVVKRHLRIDLRFSSVEAQISFGTHQLQTDIIDD